MERNVGFCFVIYGGPTAASAAAKAVEFDGVEFRGRVLTVRLDDGRRLKERAEERSKWAAADGSPEVRKEYRSKWHEEREVSRKEFRRVVESEVENWQAVVSAFQRVKKVLDTSVLLLLWGLNSASLEFQMVEVLQTAIFLFVMWS